MGRCDLPVPYGCYAPALIARAVTHRLDSESLTQFVFLLFTRMLSALDPRTRARNTGLV
jgi:hypothetical protein